MTNLTTNLGWEVAGANKKSNLIKKTTTANTIDQSKNKLASAVKNITATNIRELNFENLNLKIRFNLTNLFKFRYILNIHNSEQISLE